MSIGFIRQAYFLQKLTSQGICIVTRHTTHQARPQSDILQYGHIREQIEILKHHSNLSSMGGDFLLGLTFPYPIFTLIADRDSIQGDPASLILLE